MSVVAQSPFTAGTKRLFDDENDAPRGGEAAQAHAPDAFEYLVPCVRDEV